MQKNNNKKIEKKLNPLKNNRGQGLIEYLILVGLIAVATIGVVRVVGHNMASQYENINRAMGAGNGQALRAESATASQLRQRDLGDFVSGSRNQ